MITTESTLEPARNGPGGRSLFFKIFLWFIIALSIIILLGGVTAFVTHKHMTRTDIRSSMEEVIKNNSETIAELKARGNSRELRKLLQEIQRTYRLRLFILPERWTPHNKIKDHENLSRDLSPLFQKVLSTGETVFQFRRTSALFISPLPIEAEDSFFLVGIHRLPPPFFHRADKTGFLFHLFLVIMTGAIACYWLANHITSPVKKMRQTTLKIAEGDLSQRVDEKLLQRKDELGELARNFNAMAEKLEELVGAQKRLLRDISHELRSPLTRLNLSLELARKQSSEENAGYLNRIEKESLEMNEMIGQILSLARMETEPERGNKEIFDIVHLVETIVSDADFEANARNCHVELNSPKEFIMESEPELIKRAVENITRNAVRHTREGSTIEVSITPSGVEGLIISIRDHGSGVREEDLEKIFRPFYRLDESRDRKLGGTGLGLAIAERSIRLLGGTIKASNMYDGGLIVKIELQL